MKRPNHIGYLWRGGCLALAQQYNGGHTMPQAEKAGNLELDQDPAHVRHEWTMERIGWFVMALVLLAALLGLLGPGPLSWASTGAEETGLQIHYHRFEHHSSPHRLEVYVGAGMAQEGALRLRVDRDYLEQVEVTQIDPEPEQMELTANEIIYTFNVPMPDQPVRIFFYTEVHGYGLVPASIEVVGGPKVDFSQFFYP
jgi:hypothetical protein